MIKVTAAAIGTVIGTAILGFAQGFGSKIGEKVATDVWPALEQRVHDLLTHVVPLLQ